MTGGLAARTLLLIGSSLLALLIAELTVRVVAVDGETERTLLFSSSTFRLDEYGAVRFVPEQEIRTVAVYDGTIEYDVVFRTNDLGFVDDQDYGGGETAGEAAVRYAFLGDSFTAGWHGGRPWVPALRDRLATAWPPRSIYNLGVTGTGVRHFQLLLRSTSRQLDFTHIVILGLSDDFGRGLWYPLADQRGIRFCREGTTRGACMRKGYVAGIIERAADETTIERAAESLQSKRGRRELTRSHLLRLLKRTWKRPASSGAEPPPDALAALGAIREAFSSAEIHFIHLPQKNEVRAGRYDLEPGPELRGMGIAYFPALAECKWNAEMFLPRDGHPNRGGYRAISECVSQYLFAPEAVSFRTENG